FGLHFGHFAIPSFEVTFETDLAALFGQPVLVHTICMNSASYTHPAEKCNIHASFIICVKCKL
ncbi:MAG TPA: hypothetical protein DCP12_00785, partial [Rhodobiaceae bacterium]|nr:hypothetical protein [Rhodobiaceae bacterium]